VYKEKVALKIKKNINVTHLQPHLHPFMILTIIDFKIIDLDVEIFNFIF